MVNEHYEKYKETIKGGVETIIKEYSYSMILSDKSCKHCGEVNSLSQVLPSDFQIRKLTKRRDK